MTEREPDWDTVMESEAEARRDHAIDQIVAPTEHGVHGGWQVTSTGVIVCAWDGEPIAEAPGMPA